MTVTTIKLDSDLRDRLKRVARREGRTVGSLLESLLSERERAERFAAMREAMERSSSRSLSDYQAEVATWERAADADSESVEGP